MLGGRDALDGGEDVGGRLIWVHGQTALHRFSRAGLRTQCASVGRVADFRGAEIELIVADEVDANRIEVLMLERLDADDAAALRRVVLLQEDRSVETSL